MKIYTLLTTFAFATIGSLVAAPHPCHYHLHSYAESPSITLAVGEKFDIEGDEKSELVGGDNLPTDPSHFIAYSDVGGDEYIKTTYNYSLWNFQQDASSAAFLKTKKDNSYFGNWIFVATNPGATSVTFTNPDGLSTVFEVTVLDQ